MPQDSHRNTRVHVESCQQRGASTPGVMHADTAYASLGAPQVEPSTDCPRLDRPACAGGTRSSAGQVPPACSSRERMRSCARRWSLRAARKMSGSGKDISAAIGLQVLLVDELACSMSCWCGSLGVPPGA
jgi:hypothetical protein